MPQNNFCVWCQQRVKCDQHGKEVDKLLLHTIRMNGATKTCEELYRNYCRFIKSQA